MKLIPAMLIGFSCLTYSIIAFAQEDIPGRAAELIAYPFKNFNLISPRFDRVNFGNEKYLNSYIVRGIFTRKEKQHFRIDIPFASSNATKDGSTVGGFSDASLRFTQMFGQVKNVFYGAACKVVFPTATDAALGGGKWQAHPGLGGIYIFPKYKGSIYFAMEYRFSFAGQKDRPGVKLLGIAPNIDYWGKRYYIGYYATWLYDFHRKRWDIPLDVEAGYFITKKIVLSGEYILPLLDDATYINEFAIKLRFNLWTIRKK